MSEVLEAVMTQFVFDIEDLDPAETRLFGGKATGLARMASAGIPVPPAFAVSTDAFRAFQASGQRLPASLRDELDAAIKRLSDKSGRLFGGDGVSADPLLVSVRSGAQVSMPGMMDTVLNLGLDAESASAIIRRTGKRVFVIDSYLRFWKMYLEIVLGLDGDEFVDAVADVRSKAEEGQGALADLEKAVVAFVEEQGEKALTDPRDQLDQAIAAVFGSWNSPRAKAYREHQGISHDLGTAVTVQTMVFGNAEGDSGSGVAFSRNPNTGEPTLYGEYLEGRQGEDIVSGSQTPVDLASDAGRYADLKAQLDNHSHILEKIYGDAVDIEFTLESGRLHLLQVRPAKRTAAAAVRIAADLIDEGLIPPKAGLRLVSAEQISRLLRPVFDQDQLGAAKALATGVGSSPGQASGIAVLDSDRAAEIAATGEPVLLVRPTTSPLDIRGMLAASGILTAKGGALSHAAVVSRALDRPCVVGCDALVIDEAGRRFSIAGQDFEEGDYLSIDGASGEVYGSKIDLASPGGGAEGLERVLQHADRESQVGVWAAATPQSADLGIAVINLADVALEQGLIDLLIDGVTALGQGYDPEGEALAAAAKAIAEAIKGKYQGREVHIRLPRPGSSRARFLIPAWPELDQRLFLPIGNPAFPKAMLRGIADAYADEPIRPVVLIGGVSDQAEWDAFQKEANALGLSGGVVIQSVAGLDAVGSMEAGGAHVWIDLDEVISSSHGLVSKPYLSSSTMDAYVDEGRISANPYRTLKPFLADLLSGSYGSEGRVGVLFASEPEPTLLRQLYARGFRSFSVPGASRHIARLLLGQVAAEG